MPDVGLCRITAVTSLLCSGPHCAVWVSLLSSAKEICEMRGRALSPGCFRILDLFYSADVLVLEGTKQGPGEVSTKHTETLSLIWKWPGFSFILILITCVNYPHRRSQVCLLWRRVFPEAHVQDC